MVDLSGFWPIPGYHPYLAHADGRIAVGVRVRTSPHPRWGTPATRTLRSRILSSASERKGYPRVSLYLPDGDATRQVTASVHRLVALAFHGHPEPGQTHCAHIDGDPTNNRADNLMWCTQGENFRHKAGHHAGTQWGARSLSPAQVIEVRALRRSGMTQRAIADRIGTNQSTVSHVLTGKSYADISGGWPS